MSYRVVLVKVTRSHLEAKQRSLSALFVYQVYMSHVRKGTINTTYWYLNMITLYEQWPRNASFVSPIDGTILKYHCTSCCGCCSAAVAIIHLTRYDTSCTNDSTIKSSSFGKARPSLFCPSCLVPSGIGLYVCMMLTRLHHEPQRTPF